MSDGADRDQWQKNVARAASEVVGWSRDRVPSVRRKLRLVSARIESRGGVSGWPKEIPKH